MLKLGTKVDDMLKAWTKADDAARIEGTKRLGLPENNTAADRATAMGFGDDVYHGRYSDYNEIDPSKSFYTTTDPEYASIYTNPNASSMGGKTSADFKDVKPNVMPLRIQNSKMLDTRTTEGNRVFEDEFFGKYGNMTPLTERNLPDWTDAEDFGYMFDSKKMPYKGVMIDEKSTIGANGELVNRGVSTRVFDPSTVRSKFAHFNPKYAGIGAGSILSANLMADELDLEHKPKVSAWDSLMNTISGVNQQQAQAYGDTGAGAFNIAGDVIADPSIVAELGIKGARGTGLGMLLQSNEVGAAENPDFFQQLQEKRVR
jgi:hypothetical protein